jgi:hypothetical protein
MHRNLPSRFQAAPKRCAKLVCVRLACLLTSMKEKRLKTSDAAAKAIYPQRGR